MHTASRLAVWFGSAAAAAIAATSVAQAGAFAIREQSACGQGSSFAGVAAGCSLSSMFWNPATLSSVEGIEIEAVATGVFPFSDVTVDAPVPSDEGDIAQDALVPAGYAAYRLNDRVVFGIGVNSAFGLTTQYDSTSLLRAVGIAGTSEVFSLNANPAIAVQLNDWLALALGAQIQFIDVRLTAQALPAPLGISTIEGDDFGFGLTAGVLVTPAPGTEIGLGYRSRINHELDGELRSGIGTFDITGDGLDLPDTVTFGIRQRIGNAFRVMAGAEWSNWSRFDTVTVTGPATIPLPFEYDDGWFFSLGGEYDITQNATLRAGIGYELSPIDDDVRTYRLPDSDRLWLSAGGSFRASDRVTFDAGYTFILADEADILPAGGGGPIPNGPFAGENEGRVHIISAALRVKFGGPPPAVITK
jgi:long-chain fatty acid transport protein